MSGMNCTITFLNSGTSAKFSIEETQKLIAEGDKRADHSFSQYDSLDVTIDSGPSTIDKTKENQLLSQIEEWCNVPSKHPYRNDRDISFIDRANEKLKESLADLSARGKMPNSDEIDSSYDKN